MLRYVKLLLSNRDDHIIQHNIRWNKLRVYIKNKEFILYKPLTIRSSTLYTRIKICVLFNQSNISPPPPWVGRCHHFWFLCLLFRLISYLVPITQFLLSLGRDGHVRNVHHYLLFIFLVKQKYVDYSFFFNVTFPPRQRKSTILLKRAAILWKLITVSISLHNPYGTLRKCHPN